ncbi:hypothetical protein JCM19294_2591 [Nonlabens tegetincola]|uniref:Uncharacterized protein n=1 Tax=Nonlabens tegetincola TaxID=323273 RepID=A0A090PY77_9FLAO|nr:hypothetical protein JCM19294_2591 [Nonlabens tegetincola]
MDCCLQASEMIVKSVIASIFLIVNKMMIGFFKYAFAKAIS